MKSSLPVIKDIIIFIFIGIFLFQYLKGCFTGSTDPKAEEKKVIATTHKTDTIINLINVSVPEIKPTPSSSVTPVVVQPTYQHASSFEGLLKQNNELFAKNNELIQKLLTENRYTDSVQLKDSIGNIVGVFRNNDLVTNNEIKSRAPSYSISYKIITNTDSVFLAQPPKPVNQVFFGGEIGGYQNPYTNLVGAGLLFKNKRDQIFKLNATINTAGGLGGNVGFYSKIRFGRKKF